jgi:iron complex outermembrane recepter protein
MKKVHIQKKNFVKRAAKVYTAMLLIGTGSAFGQADTTVQNSLEGLSLKDLLDIKIVSVSKKTESLFGAPLSASVLSREQIQRAGCTSIMEALRLVPGMIVREQTNGNYDVQMRGVYTSPNPQFDGSSVTTLVMIDGRPIFNYLQGGTFWETLPVDLNDVEKIEVVRGPSGALYGPNAVAGVINIITRQPQQDGFYSTINSRQGSYHTFINNASIGFRTRKWNLVGSGNYQQRDRTQTSYFEFFRNQYFENPDYFIGILGDTVRGMDIVYPDHELSVKRYAGNIFANFTGSEKFNLSFSSGIQHSQVQKVSAENGNSPLTASQSDTRYADLRANISGLTARVSFIEGTQIPDRQPGNKYDFNTLDASVEYNITKGNFSIKPGYAYRSAVYDDTKYSDITQLNGMFNARGRITLNSFSLRSEYKLSGDKIRLVGGFSTNRFNYPDEINLSYQVAATWKVKKNHILRAVVSRTPRSSNIYDTYVNQHITFFPIGYRKYTLLQLEGYTDLTLLTARMMELGYRGRIAKGLDIDVELFNIHSKNYSMNVINGPYVRMADTDTIIVVPLRPTNIPLTTGQYGLTVSLNWVTKDFQFKPFITVQKTQARHYAPFANTPDAPPLFVQSNPAVNNIFSGLANKATVKTAPAVFGGFAADYAVSSKLNINLNAYYYSAHTITHAINILFNDGVRGIDRIPAKLIMNATLSYEVLKGVQLTVSGKNLLNNESREFYKTDAVPFMMVGGIQCSF